MSDEDKCIIYNIDILQRSDKTFISLSLIFCQNKLECFLIECLIQTYLMFGT